MVIAIAPCFDEVTEHSFNWINRLVDNLSEECEKLFKDEATREKFENRVAHHTLIIFYDHGTKNGLISQDGNTYVIDKKNAHLLKGKEVYTLACLWCSDGGIDAYKKGARAVWGYTEEFAFTSDDEDLFMECANFGLLIKRKEGISWEEALQKAKEKFNEAIKKAKSGWSIIWLRYDRDALVCYTESNPPNTSKCIFRRMAITIFGPKKAWKIKIT